MIVLMKVISRLSSCQICRIIFSVLIFLDLSVVFNTGNKLLLETLFSPLVCITTQYLFYYCFSNHSGKKIGKKTKQKNNGVKQSSRKERKGETKKIPRERRRGRTRKWRGKEFIHDRDYHIIVPTPTFVSCVIQ